MNRSPSLSLLSSIMLVIIALIMMFSFMTPVSLGVQEDTYYIPIHGDIMNSTFNFVQRAYDQAILEGASAIIFGIDTYGGYVDSAINLKNLIMSSAVPTVCIVENKAISAGALIAISGEKLVMRPGTTIGAAEPRIGNEKADEKTMSMWRTQLSSVAESRGRDGQIAAAMADTDIVIEGLSEKDKLLTLGDIQALSLGFIDGVFNTTGEVMAEYNLPGNLVEIEPNVKENATRWFANPIVSAVLLTIGIVGIAIELFIPGFGIFGIVGVLSFITYFIGHFWAGNTGWGAVLLFVLGIILVVLEIFVIPGFGAAGILGAVSILASVFMASPNIQYALISLVIAIVASVVLIILSFRNRKTRKVWRKLVLNQKLDAESGYSSQTPDLDKYLDAVGIAITPLRPAGTAMFGSDRVDVVTEGTLIGESTRIKVIEVSGGRIVVRAFQGDEGDKTPIEPSSKEDSGLAGKDGADLVD